jgi:hypothetical protein
MGEKMGNQNDSHFFHVGRWVFFNLYPEKFNGRARSLDLLCFDAQCLPDDPALVLPAWDHLVVRDI